MIRFSVFVTSFSILAYEIVFARIFAWSQWVNLSSLIITMALLGFGAAGSLISLFQGRIEKRLEKVFFAGLVLLLLFPPGFFMGMPFACGLTRIKQDQAAALPRAWAINGFAGVVSILVAALLAILSGFRTVLILAAVFYALAGLLSIDLKADRDQSSQGKGNYKFSVLIHF